MGKKTRKERARARWSTYLDDIRDLRLSGGRFASYNSIEAVVQGNSTPQNALTLAMLQNDGPMKEDIRVKLSRGGELEVFLDSTGVLAFLWYVHLTDNCTCNGPLFVLYDPMTIGERHGPGCLVALKKYISGPLNGVTRGNPQTDSKGRFVRQMVIE